MTSEHTPKKTPSGSAAGTPVFGQIVQETCQVTTVRPPRGQRRRRIEQTKGLTLARLLLLARVAQEGSIIQVAGGVEALAAQYCRQIKQLECSFNMVLLQRQGRHVVLTPRGRELGGILHDLLYCLESFYCDGQNDPFRVGAPDCLRHLLLVPQIGAITRQCPVARHISLHNLPMGDIAERLHERALDFGVLEASQLRPGLLPFPIRKIDFVFVARAPLPKPPQLARHPWVVPQAWRPFAERALAAAAQSGLQLGTRVEVESFADVRTAVQTGSALAFLPDLPALPHVITDAFFLRPGFLQPVVGELFLATVPRLLQMRVGAGSLAEAILAQTRPNDL